MQPVCWKSAAEDKADLGCGLMGIFHLIRSNEPAVFLYGGNKPCSYSTLYPQTCYMPARQDCVHSASPTASSSQS